MKKGLTPHVAILILISLIIILSLIGIMWISVIG